jgi:gamma-glutamyl-gamma-aminobutyrate hydrolase PuuD
VSVVVGIACNPRNVSSSRGKVAAETVARSYVDAVRRAGGLPLLVPVLDPDEVGPLLDSIDRVLVIGGGDVDPACYGEPPVPESGEPNAARDAFEIALVRASAEREVRTLAICRGMQVANVAFGGSLAQHIEHHGGDVRHRVRVDAGSVLSGAVGATALDANSQHHQAVDRVGAALRAVAWAEDGTVEGVESADGALLGVQWHPELLTDEAEHLALFRWLVG